MKKFFSCPAP